MMNRDWDKLGETIRNTVQEAIDSQDFEMLNQTITNTINSAIDGFSQGIKNAGKAKNQYRKQNSCQQRTCQQNSGQQWGYSYKEQTVDQQQQVLVQRYRRTTAVKVWGYISVITGGALGLVFFLLLVLAIVGTLFEGAEILYGIVASLVVLGIPGAVCGILAWKGISKINKESRFQGYVQKIGNREYCNIKELAERSGRKMKYVVKDLEYMIKKGWFLQGHLDESKTCLILTDTMYRQYIGLQKERMQTEREEAAQKAQEQAQQKKQEQETQKVQMEYEKLAPEIRQVIEKGDAYIRKIHECNDAIPGEEISAKISHMELLVDRIFDRIEQNPESVDDIQRMLEYYLPTTVKLLEAYQELDEQPVDGENIRSSKTEIEATLDTLNIAFEKLLDDLFQDTAWDLSSDISVLRTMLAQEGLTEDDWGK